MGKAFVKLSTRSPKDSKRALAKAAESYHARVADIDIDAQRAVNSEFEPGQTLSDNNRWIILCEEVANASAVSSAGAALEMLLDSDRVYEGVFKKHK